MGALAESSGVRGGFVHVPLLPEQALDRATPTVPLATLAARSPDRPRDRLGNSQTLTAR